jgi:hypothetical protein
MGGRDCISRKMLAAREMISSPAAVVRVSARPSRSNNWKPSSSSSNLSWRLTPGCEVCSWRAAAVMFKPFSWTATRYRNCWNFIRRSAGTGVVAAASA